MISDVADYITSFGPKINSIAVAYENFELLEFFGRQMQHFDNQRRHQLCLIVCFAGRRFAQVQIFSSSWPPQVQMILKKAYMSFHCNEVGVCVFNSKARLILFLLLFFFPKDILW